MRGCFDKDASRRITNHPGAARHPSVERRGMGLVPRRPHSPPFKGGVARQRRGGYQFPMILFRQGKPTHPETFAEYCAAGGYSPIERDILQEVIDSGLQGRGGAGFPVGKKWTIAAETTADKRYVVCNAGEDEPGSFKDRILLEHRPHLVLEGMLLAARAIRAREVFLYLNETYDECYRRFSAAIEEARPE